MTIAVYTGCNCHIVILGIINKTGSEEMKKIICVILVVCILCSSFSSCASIRPLGDSKVTVGEWLEMLCTTFGMVEPVNSNFENNLETAKIWSLISTDFSAKEDEEIVVAFASETILNVFEFDEKQQEKINDILGFTSKRKGLDKVNEKTAKAAIEYAHSCWANYTPESRSNYEVSEKTLEIDANAIEEANESKGTFSINSTYSNQDYIFLDEEIWENSGRIFAIDKNASYDGNIVAKQISEEIELEEVFDKVDTAGTIRAKVSDVFAYDANGNKIPVEYETGTSNLSATEIPSIISLNTMGRAVSSEGKRFQIPLGTKMKLIGETKGSKIDFEIEYDGKSSKDIGMSAFASVDFGDVSYEYVSEEKYVYLKTDFDIRYGFSANGAKMVLPENVSKDILSGSKDIKEAIKELEDIYKSPFSDMLDEFNASPLVDKEKYSIALIEVPLYTDGVNSVTVKLSIFLKMDGTIGIETVMDENVIGVEYRKGAGIRPIFDLSEPKTEIELDLSARVGLGVGLFYKVINYPIVDCTFDFGVDAECSGKIIDLNGTYFCGAVSLPKHAFEELSKYGYFTDDSTIHSCVDVNCGIFLDFSIGENSLLGKVKSTSWTLVNPRKTTIYSTHADDRKTVEKCIFEDIGGVENYEPTEIDFAKLDEWFRQRWEEESNLRMVRIPSSVDNKIYYVKNGDSWGGYQLEKGELWQYDLASGENEKLFEFNEILQAYSGFSYCVFREKVYISTMPTYYYDDNDDRAVNIDYAKLFSFDIGTRELKLLRDDLCIYPVTIGSTGDGVIIIGDSFEDPYATSWASEGNWNITVNYEGRIINPINKDFDFSQIGWFAGHIGDSIVSNGEKFVAYEYEENALYRISGDGNKSRLAYGYDFVELTALDNERIFYTNCTNTQDCIIEIDYLKYYNLLDGEKYESGVDVHYKGLNMIGVMGVFDEMIYIAYTNIKTGCNPYGDYHELNDYRRDFVDQHDFPETEGYYFYLYRYNMETGEYTLVAQ